MTYPLVLIASPTYAGKEYAFERYVAAVEAQRYPADFGLLLVDNTPDDGTYLRRLQDAAESRPWMAVDRIEPREDIYQTIAAAWNEAIIPAARLARVPYVLSLEPDTIVDPDALRVLMDNVLRNDLSILAHAYRPRASTGLGDIWLADLGCTLAETDLWVQGMRGRGTRTMLDIAGHRGLRYGGLFGIEHLDDPDEGYAFEGPDPRREVI